MQIVEAFIALGSNLANPILQITEAIFRLYQIENITLQNISSFYYNQALGNDAQPEFINVVLGVKTQLTPIALLKELQSIENAQGRQRKIYWGARTLDLDLLLYGQDYIHNDTLTLPHPAMLKRNFVLYPLFEIAPDLRLPDGQWLREVVQTCDQGGLEKLNSVVTVPARI